MLSMDSQTGVSRQLLGRAPRSADELISTYAGLLAGAANVEASTMALMVPGVPASAIARVLRRLEGEPTLRRASDAVVEWMRALRVVKGWGRGFEALADMVSLDTSRHVYLGRQDPRRRRFAVGSYLHILKASGIVYDRPFSSNSSRTAAVTCAVLALPPKSRVCSAGSAMTRSIACISFAAAAVSPRCSSIRTADQKVPTGFASPFPMMSNADPWMGSNIEG